MQDDFSFSRAEPKTEPSPEERAKRPLPADWPHTAAAADKAETSELSDSWAYRAGMSEPAEKAEPSLTGGPKGGPARQPKDSRTLRRIYLYPDSGDRNLHKTYSYLPY